MTEEKKINLGVISTYKTVLIIEDEDPIRWALKASLVKEGFIVLEAKNGQDGLNLALSRHPGLIVLDMLLPKMYGIDVLKKIRNDSWGKNALVVVLSSIDEKITIEAEALGIKDYIIKQDWKLDEAVKFIKSKLGF